MKLNEDAALFATVLSPGKQVEHTLDDGRHAWVHVVRGLVKLNGATLSTGDGAALSDTKKLELNALDESEVLVFDLA